MADRGACGYFVELIIGPWGEDSQWQGLAPLFLDGASVAENRHEHGPWENEARALSAFEAKQNDQSTVDHRLVSESEWFWTIAGNA
jgi:hypothetical protein